MRSTALDLSKYDTDKIPNGYIARYDQEIAHLADAPVRLLELGVHNGGSLLFWRDYFPAGHVTGVDLTLPTGLEELDRVRMFEGDQTDTAFLTRVANNVAPGGFDIIIDDAAHIGVLARTSFWHLYRNHLRPGGTYVIEDWGTGYWPSWPDGAALRREPETSRHRPMAWPTATRLGRRLAGKLGLMKRPLASHQFGMVGFLKQLIDDVGSHDASTDGRGATPTRLPSIDSVTIYPSIAFVRKAG